MTPNKLPPLPEPHITDGNHILFPCGGRGYWGFSPEQVQAITWPLQAKIDALMLEYCPDEMTPEQMETWAAHQAPVPEEESEKVAEALRQSQSLPAGAVADGPVFYVQRTYDCNAGEDRGEIIPTLPANLIGKRVRLVPVDAAIHVEYNWEEDCKSAESALEAMTDAFNNVCDELKALQADAREKGEIADLESDIDTLVDHNMALQSAIRDAINIHSSFGTTADMADWLRDELEALATQPAQASESGLRRDLRKLADYWIGITRDQDIAHRDKPLLAMYDKALTKCATELRAKLKEKE